MNEKYYRLYERIVAIEDNLEALGPVDKLIERVDELEKMVKQTKTVLGFDEACKYIGVSESLLYKLTAAKEVPHYKPRGKMLYFNREEIDKWLPQRIIQIIEKQRLNIASRSTFEIRDLSCLLLLKK